MITALSYKNDFFFSFHVDEIGEEKKGLGIFFSFFYVATRFCSEIISNDDQLQLGRHLGINPTRFSFPCVKRGWGKFLYAK